MKTIIIYESNFGNTKKVTEKIRENLNLIEKNETIIKTVKEVDPIEILNFDFIWFS